ncbi:hypothetical protein CEXT_172131, partial [Caerostris extrusa]
EKYNSYPTPTYSLRRFGHYMLEATRTHVRRRLRRQRSAHCCHQYNSRVPVLAKNIDQTIQEQTGVAF